MGSFSDNYSSFGSTDLCDAKEQSFKFYKDGKLTDDNYLNTSKTGYHSLSTILTFAIIYSYHNRHNKVL